MRHATKLELKKSRPQPLRLDYGLAESRDMDRVADIYLANFPHRVQKLFPQQRAAGQFYRERAPRKLGHAAIELMR